MQFKDIESRLFIYHKANNRSFYRALFTIGALFLPVIFLFIPLPGYWILSLSVFDIRFFFTVFFLCLIVIGLLKFHTAVIHKRYFFWGVDTFGYSKFRYLYCIRRIKFCAPVFILLLAGYIEASFAWEGIFRLVAVVSLLVGFIVLLSLRQFNMDSSKYRFELKIPLNLKFVSTVIAKLSLRCIILLSISVLVAVLTNGSSNREFDLGAALCGICLNIPLLLSCTRFASKDFSSYEVFFLSLSDLYLNYQRLIYTVCILTLWVISLMPMVIFVG
jgi:hypothetical protein